MTRTVHHSCSRPASAIKAKQSKQAPTGSPSPSEWWSDPCHLPILVPVPGSGKAAATAPAKTTARPSQQTEQTHHPPTNSASNTAPPATDAASPRAHAYCSIITPTHTHTRAPCNHGRRRARYAVLSTTYRCPPDPAHSLVKMPNASAAPVSHLPLSRPRPTTHASRLLHTSLRLLKPPPLHYYSLRCPPAHRLHKH